MERFPDGIDGQGFYQKKADAYYPVWIHIASLAKQNGHVRYVVCDDLKTLLYLANQAVITPHTWLSRVDHPRHPDQMIFDLDPSGEDFKNVWQAAQALRELLKQKKLRAFVKSTGSRRLHVMVPLNRWADFDQVRAFARQIAEDLAASDPERLTTETRIAKRGGIIFIDTARNSYPQTAVPAYAVRPLDGAPVAVPLDWSELDNPKLKPDQFDIHNIFERLKPHSDPWKNWEPHPQGLPESGRPKRNPNFLLSR
jgi:bifunctional non-homologous end joining protein LigD